MFVYFADTTRATGKIRRIQAGSRHGIRAAHPVKEMDMLNNWPDFLKDAFGAIGALAKENPKMLQGLQAIEAGAESKGALDGKTRELIALAVAVTTRCDTCIAVHASKAVELGASREELLETLAMATALNAGAALVYSSRALDAFDQFAKK